MRGEGEGEWEISGRATLTRERGISRKSVGRSTGGFVWVIMGRPPAKHARLFDG